MWQFAYLVIQISFFTRSTFCHYVFVGIHLMLNFSLTSCVLQMRSYTLHTLVIFVLPGCLLFRNRSKFISRIWCFCASSDVY